MQDISAWVDAGPMYAWFLGASKLLLLLRIAIQNKCRSLCRKALPAPVTIQKDELGLKGKSHFVMETSKVPEETMQSAGVNLSPIVLFCYGTYILTKCAHQKRGTKGNNGTVTRVQPTGFKTASLEGVHDVWGLRKTVFF